MWHIRHEFLQGLPDFYSVLGLSNRLSVVAENVVGYRSRHLFCFYHHSVGDLVRESVSVSQSGLLDQGERVEMIFGKWYQSHEEMVTSCASARLHTRVLHRLVGVVYEIEDDKCFCRETRVVVEVNAVHHRTYFSEDFLV